MELDSSNQAGWSDGQSVAAAVAKWLRNRQVWSDGRLVVKELGAYQEGLSGPLARRLERLDDTEFATWVQQSGLIVPEGLLAVVLREGGSSAVGYLAGRDSYGFALVMGAVADAANELDSNPEVLVSVLETYSEVSEPFALLGILVRRFSTGSVFEYVVSVDVSVEGVVTVAGVRTGDG